MKYLITGVTGSGKTTISKELKKRGYLAYDSDGVEGLTRWEDAAGEPVKTLKNPPADWFNHNFWNWNRKKLQELLANEDDIFICGIASNQKEYYKLFDKIFLLVIAEEAMIHRLNTRRYNSFGRREEEQLSIKEWHGPLEKTALQYGALGIDVTQPLDKVIDEILEKK